MTSLGEKLKQARQAKGLTQEAVAEQVGVSRQTMSNWENSRSLPDIISLIRLSEVYGLSLDTMLKGDSTIMKHLQESTDVVKSNKRLAASIVLAGGLLAIFILLRVFVPVPRFKGTLPSLLAVAVFFIGLGIALAGSVNLKRLAAGKTANKTLLKLGFIVLYALVYIPLVLALPEALAAALPIEAGWLAGACRALCCCKGSGGCPPGNKRYMHNECPACGCKPGTLYSLFYCSASRSRRMTLFRPSPM